MRIEKDSTNVRTNGFRFDLDRRDLEIWRLETSGIR